MELTGKQRRHLRALAHHLSPVAYVGQQGVSEHVLEHLDRELGIHELLKVKVNQESPISAREAAPLLAEPTGASVAQVIGRTIVLYRAHPKEPQIRLPSGS